jgi:hypothetical protein
MKKDRKTRCRREDGIALLIAIFVLLLISVVAIALLVSSGTETALGANYRASSTVYYAALAGLEEARGRLLPKNPNYFGASDVPTPFPLNQTLYVINRTPGDSIVPWDQSNQYYDKEYKSEFGVDASSVASPQSISSLWDNNAQGIPGPMYKWVRINAVTDQSLFIQIDNTAYHSGTPVYYDPAHLDYGGNPWPSLIVGPTSTAMQVLEITALASLPNGSQKYLQYLVTPVALNLNLPAAVVLDGNAPLFTAPTSTNFYVKGIDQGSAGSCNPGGTPFTAVGYTDTTMTTSSFEQPTNAQGISTSSPDLRGHYANGLATNPNIAPVTLSANLTTVAGLNSLVQTIEETADVVINRDATQADMPAAMSPSNPMTIVVKGDLVFSGWHSTGYGLLLVTGNTANMSTAAFTYDPDASWNGIILVVGKGSIYSYQGSFTTTQIQGGVLLAKTVDASGNPLPSYTSGSPTPLGSPYFHFISSSASNGIYYSSCWIQAVQSPTKYQVLSFHEIPVNQ